ncbi:hypothetical protein F5146DRAFT_1223103 [Armillaria mellea]|nr:hypothetical protein F5146DRAFT_1223103 [Armillaria mellea]
MPSHQISALWYIYIMVSMPAYIVCHGYESKLYMDGLDAMPQYDTGIVGMESIGGKDKGGELGCMNIDKSVSSSIGIN